MTNAGRRAKRPPLITTTERATSQSSPAPQPAFDLVGDTPTRAPGLLTVVHDALSRLGDGATGYVRVEIPVEDLDPFEWLSAAAGPVFAWADGTRGMTFVAGPAIAVIQPSLDETLSEACSALCEQVYGQTDGPLLAGGCAFSEATRWAEWPLAQFVLPAWQVVRDADGPARCFLTTQIQAGQTPDEVVARLEAAAPMRVTPEAETESSGWGEIAASPVESKASWMSRVHAAAETVSSGAFAKVVLAREVTLSPPDGQRFDAAATLRTLRRQHPGSMTFAVHIPGRGVFLGATPETLVCVQGMEVGTHALAGTIRRGTDAAEDDALARQLFESAKDRVEHRVVVDAIVDTLRPLCSDLRVEEVPHPIRLSQVQHLATPIVGRLKEHQNVLSLARRLHPTPAVGGWPRDVAARYLDAEEPTERGWYAAPIGWIDRNGDGVFGVAIRSALVRAERARAWVGAGIVSASDPEAEWRETALKLRTVASGLALIPYDHTSDTREVR